MNKKINNYVFWLVILVWSSLFIVLILNKQEEKPLMFADIPPETKKFFKDLSLRNGEFSIEFVKRIRKKDYSNQNDFGQDSINGYLILQDKYFIIYLSNNEDEKIRARKTLKYANNAIGPLKQFFGHYFYPEDLQGRKLAIYLADSRPEYSKICSNLGIPAPAWSAAITYMVYGSDGNNMCKGIVISECVKDNTENPLDKILKHEMAHFIHLMSLNIKAKKKLLDWECEGIATFFAGEIKEVPNNARLIYGQELEKPMKSYQDSYWVGNSVFRYFSTTYGNKPMEEMIQSSYDKYLISILPTYTNTSMSIFQTNWKKYCVANSR